MSILPLQSGYNVGPTPSSTLGGDGELPLRQISHPSSNSYTSFDSSTIARPTAMQGSTLQPDHQNMGVSGKATDGYLPDIMPDYPSTFGDSLYDNPWKNSPYKKFSQRPIYDTIYDTSTPVLQGPPQTDSRLASSLYGGEANNNIPNRVQQAAINESGKQTHSVKSLHSNDHSYYDGNSSTPEDVPGAFKRLPLYRGDQRAQQLMPVSPQPSLYRTTSQKLKSHVSRAPTYISSPLTLSPSIHMLPHVPPTSHGRPPSRKSTADSTYVANNPFRTPVHKKSSGISDNLTFDDIDVQGHVTPPIDLSAEPGGHGPGTGTSVPRYISQSPTKFLTSSPETLRSGYSTNSPPTTDTSITNAISTSQPLATEHENRSNKNLGKFPHSQSTQLRGTTPLPITVTPVVAKNRSVYPSGDPARQYPAEPTGVDVAAEMLEYLRNLSNNAHRPSKTDHHTNQTHFLPLNNHSSTANAHVQKSEDIPGIFSNSQYNDGRTQHTMPSSPVPSIHRTAPQRQSSRASRRSIYISSAPPVSASRPTSPHAHPSFSRTRTPSRKSTIDSVYVANNPFRKQTLKNNSEVADGFTFDDIDIQDHVSQADDISATMGGMGPAGPYAPKFPEPRYNHSATFPYTPNTHISAKFNHPNSPANHHGEQFSQSPTYLSPNYLPSGASLPVTPTLVAPVVAVPIGAPPVYPSSAGFWSAVRNHFRWPDSGIVFKDEVEVHYGDAPDVIPADLEELGHSTFIISFVFLTLPRQIYLHLLLRLPLLYFSRVSRIFEEARLTMAEIKGMAIQTTSPGTVQTFDGFSIELTTAKLPPQYEKLKMTWELFIESVMREWKTFNVVSVLLLSAILTILQISDAAEDFVTRYTALLSLICALVSLLFGCIYIIRFGSMRKTYRAAEWAMEGQKTNTAIWWNVWVLLAMPAIWLTWSILLYIACIMSFIWRTSTQSTGKPQNLSSSGLLAVRIVISVVLGLGIVYGALILSTFSRYGEAMDRAWQGRIDGWIKAKIAGYSSNRSSVYNMPSGPAPVIIQEDNTQFTDNNLSNHAEFQPSPSHYAHTLPTHNQTPDVHSTETETHNIRNTHNHTHDFRSTDAEPNFADDYYEPGLTLERNNSTGSFEICIEPPSRPPSSLMEELQYTHSYLSPNHSPIPLPQVTPESYEIVGEPASRPQSILVETEGDTDSDPNSPVQVRFAPYSLPHSFLPQATIDRDGVSSFTGWGDPSRADTFGEGSSTMTSGPPGSNGGESFSPDVILSPIWMPIPIPSTFSNSEDDTGGFDAITIHNTRINATAPPPGASQKKKERKY